MPVVADHLKIAFILLSCSVSSIARLQGDAVHLNIVICLVHPATAAGKVLSIAIDKLLDRVLLEGLVGLVARNHSKRFESSRSGEGPASSTGTLVVRSRHISFFVPILIVW